MNKFYKQILSNYCKKCSGKQEFHGTTVLAVRRLNKVVMVADGQMTLGHTQIQK